MYTVFFPAVAFNRPATLTTGASAPIKVATVVDTNNIGSIDILSFPFTQMKKGVNTIPLAINNADGSIEEVSCRFATVSEAGGLAPYPHIAGNPSNAAINVTSDCKLVWDTSAGFATGESHAVQLTAYTDADHWTQATFEVSLIDSGKAAPQWYIFKIFYS